MSGQNRPVQLVLDTSAIVAFAAGSIAVGELIAEIDDEEGATGLPVLCWRRRAVAQATMTG